MCVCVEGGILYIIGAMEGAEEGGGVSQVRRGQRRIRGSWRRHQHDFGGGPAPGGGDRDGREGRAGSRGKSDEEGRRCATLGASTHHFVGGGWTKG